MLRGEGVRLQTVLTPHLLPWRSVWGILQAECKCWSTHWLQSVANIITICLLKTLAWLSLWLACVNRNPILLCLHVLHWRARLEYLAQIWHDDPSGPPAALPRGRHSQLQTDVYTGNSPCDWPTIHWAFSSHGNRSPCSHEIFYTTIANKVGMLWKL